MMRLKFHQLDLLCVHALERAQAYRRQFSLSEKAPQTGQGDALPSQRGEHRGVRLHFIEQSPLDSQRSLAASNYGIASVSYQCTDVEQAHAYLRRQGATPAWGVRERDGVRNCAFFDADGLLFQIAEPSATLAEMELGETPAPGKPPVRLHHVSILTPDLRRAQRFYERFLGLKTVFEFLREGGGFIFLADGWFDHQEHPFLLEIIGPPHLEPREEQILSARGACYDHICFSTRDVDAAWRWALEQGAQPVLPPYHYEGTRMAWLKDDQGVDIEIMAPIPKFVLDYALHIGKPLNGQKKWKTAWALVAYAWHRRFSAR